ncbi:pentapeptide repeat-containing protein [Acerihabitans arboris]|uniref:pentapeptide repeat-containing protein n=1 Tax=Acerihabitans arboris TaxID=2691583 RepID=UPI0013910487|nr:pentapeptide repeat-containing protein [Acerihabitans arboris]
MKNSSEATLIAQEIVKAPDLRGIDLSGLNLSNVDLHGKTLAWANLSEADLRKANLRDANLGGAKLGKTDLRKADLSYANLGGANLGGAKLGKADLSGANLGKADLSGTGLRKADLCYANLGGANLGKADLSGADLRMAGLCYANLGGANLGGAKLGDANLGKADLSGADLRKADLCYANLGGANLGKADLSGADLRQAKLRGADLRGADLRKANLRDANLGGAKLGGAKLGKADLSGADLRKADLCGAGLREATMHMVNLTGADLRKADLCGADLHRANLTWVNLTNARVMIDINTWMPLLSALGVFPRQLDGARLQLTLPDRWDETMLDRHLNHLNNTESGSLLKLIDSLGNNELKVQFALKLMKSLQHVDVSTVALPLLSILGKSPYSDEKHLSAWLDPICADFMQRYAGTVMPPLDEPVITALLYYFQRTPPLMLQHNHLFIQLISRGIPREDTLREKNIELYNRYLSDEQVIPYTRLNIFGNFKGRPDWSTPFADNYVLFSSRENGPVIMLSQHTLNGMLKPDPARPVWNHIFVYRGLENQSAGQYQLSELFEHDFHLFLGPYKEKERAAGFRKLLNAMQLGAMRPLFESATREKSCSEKLVSPEKREELKNIFDTLLDPSPENDRYFLKEAHYQAVMAASGLSAADLSQQARTLLCLAAVFIRYSSSAVFGTEYDSPIMLRYYAWALMAKANQLDSAVFDSGQFTNWTDSLLGLKGKFTCAAMLFHMMTEYSRKRFPEVLAGIMPPAWN